MKDNHNEINKTFEIKEKDNYDLKINYLDVNPFSNIIKQGFSNIKYGATNVVIALFFGSFEAAASTFIGASFLIGGMAFMTIGLCLGIFGGLGSITFNIYKLYKKNQCEEFYKKLSNLKEMKEEREVYIEALSKIDSFFIKYFKPYEESNKKKIEDIIYSILGIYYQLESIWINNKIEEYRKKYSNISKFNILVIGKTGVGKSCLINGVLNLKSKKANEATNVEPQGIDGWKQKYPITEDDSDIKGLNLWDTEGIEFSKKNKNDIENHLNKINNIIQNNFVIPNEQINCLWYCVNGNRLEDEDKTYINSLLNAYKEINILKDLKSITDKYKFPTIFIYTQAFQSEQDKIDLMENALRNIDFFNSKDSEPEKSKEQVGTKESKHQINANDNENQDDYNNSEDFHFIDVIAKEKAYLNRRTKKQEIEEKYHIYELIELSLKLGKKGMSIPLLINSNKLYKEINDKANAMINKIAPIAIELTKTILGSEKNGKENIFKEALPILKKLIKNLSQEKIDKNSEIIINGYIDDITKIMLKMMEDQLQIAINYFNKKVYIDSFKSLLNKKYKEKKKKNLTESDFNDNCLDFIINPICDNIEKYGLLFLFNTVKNIVIKICFEEYEINLNNKKEKIKDIFNKYCEENYQRFIKNTNIDTIKPIENN